MKFTYREKESRLLGKILKPIIDIEVFSKKHDFWYGLDEVLVDTGADISLIPKNVGKTLVEDITKGKKVEIKGIGIIQITAYIVMNKTI